MGFGFNLLIIFVLLPFTGLLLLMWLSSGKKLIGKTLLIIWLSVLGLVIVSGIIRWINAKPILDKTNYYGEYIIDRDHFSGIQADWQYDHYRFEITERDSIFFHCTEGKEIIQTYRGSISTSTYHTSARLIINMELPHHHIPKDNPTTYRIPWDFYLVFKSPKFHNVFFKKGTWSPIN